jgi:hypothetical protein
MDEKKIQALMKSLDVSRDEAIQIIKDDEDIDDGKKLFELTPEQEKNSKKARQVSRGASKTPVKRERKADNDKRELINTLNNAILSVGTDIQVTNIEREIIFKYNNRKFKIVLSAPRT